MSHRATRVAFSVGALGMMVILAMLPAVGAYSGGPKAASFTIGSCNITIDGPSGTYPQGHVFSAVTLTATLPVGGYCDGFGGYNLAGPTGLFKHILVHTL